MKASQFWQHCREYGASAICEGERSGGVALDKTLDHHCRDGGASLLVSPSTIEGNDIHLWLDDGLSPLAMEGSVDRSLRHRAISNRDR